MATIIQRNDSSCWIACFGRLKRSTKVPVRGRDREETAENRKRAALIAEAWEAASCGSKTEIQLRRVIADTSERISGKRLSLETVKGYTARWLKIKAMECEKGTVEFYKATLDRFLSYLGKRADSFIGDIHAEDVRDFLAGRRQRVSPRTVNHELKSLKTFFRSALHEMLIAENPTEFVKPIKEPKALPRRPFTVDEIQKILAVADDEWRSMVICAIYTGQRLSDLATLTWRNFDLAANEMRIVTRKTGKNLTIPLPSPLRAHLDTFATTEGPLHPRAFASVESRGRGNALSTQFGDLLARAGLRPKKAHRKSANGRDGRHHRHEVSFHSFRRTATTWLHEAGVPPAVVQALIGHDSIDEHQGYIGVGKAALLDAATKFPNLISHAV